MNKRLLPLLFMTAVIVASCVAKKPAQVDYSLISVPQEGGYQFKQITSEDQAIWGPRVNNNNGKLSWYTSSMFGLSQTGDKIVYIASATGQEAEGNVYVKSTAGGRSSVQRTFGIAAVDPCFSPDGLSIAFSGTFPGQNKSNICLINTNEGSAIQHLTESQSGTATSPVFSEDGNRIFYTRGIATTTYAGTTPVTNWKYSIWSIDKTTSITTQYVEGVAPDYIAGGKLLLTKTNQISYQGEIWMIDLRSGQETLILRDNVRGFSTPKISPDGKRILCVGSSSGAKPSEANLDIFLLNIDGTGFQQLTFHPGTDASPCWSPDGKSVYFLSQRGNAKGRYNIWSIDLVK